MKRWAKRLHACTVLRLNSNALLGKLHSFLHCIPKEDIKTALFDKDDLNRLSRIKMAKKNVVERDGVTRVGVTTPPMQNPLISCQKVCICLITHDVNTTHPNL